MTDARQPADIAREALLQLAARRQPPTPDNFRTLYHEIAGTAATEAFPERALRGLLSRLPRTSPAQLGFARQVEQAIAARDWQAIGNAVNAVLAAREPPPWAGLIRDLLAQLERRQAGITSARKRDGLEHVLDSSGGEPEVLFNRLSALLRSWSQASSVGTTALPQDGAGAIAAAQQAAGPVGGAESPAAEAAAPPPPPSAPVLGDDARSLIADLLQNSVALLLVDAPDLADEAAALSALLRSTGDPAATRAFAERLKGFVSQLRWLAADQADLKAALLHLMQLIVDNIAELQADDQWLQGQIAMVSEALAPPLNLRRLDDVEHRLKEVIYKQGTLKRGLSDAKERLKAMLASFVDHLAQMSDSTGEYHDRIEHCAVRIGGAKDIAELTDVIEEVMHETRSMQISTDRARDELRLVQEKVEASEREIVRLQGELAQTSEMVRHDQLTGALNRKGLDEALGREFARAERRAAPLCIALLDVDNFKGINDGYGHRAGDSALVHLARVIRETLRPSDTLARYGGEEFVVLLPETALDSAAGVLTRLQRELTRRFFLHDDQRVLITFSAGVTQVVLGEEHGTALARADTAMYEAKRAGKNRVVAAA